MIPGMRTWRSQAWNRMPLAYRLRGNLKRLCRLCDIGWGVVVIAAPWWALGRYLLVDSTLLVTHFASCGLIFSRLEVSLCRLVYLTFEFLLGPRDDLRILIGKQPSRSCR